MWGQETYTIVLGGASWASEISMELLDGDDNLVETFTETTGLVVDTDEGDTSESPDGDAWVEAITVENADLDKYYLMLIDNFTTDSTAFDFEWDLDGVTLNCSLQLPVELVNFRGTEEKESHLLEWDTQTELNNAFFEIERSRNGSIWQTMERVTGWGNSTIPHSYRYEDKEPPFGTTYYRLRQVDFNGQYEYSETIALRHLAPLKVGKLYPNPSREAVRLVMHSDAPTDISIEVYETGGRMVHSQGATCAEGATSITLQLGDLMAGFYKLVVRDENGGVVGSTALQRF